MKKEFKNLFLSQPEIIQERTWAHFNEWKNKIYIPLLNIPAHRQKDFGISAFSEKLNNLIKAVENKDLDMCSTYHQALGSVVKLNSMLMKNDIYSSNRNEIFFKRMFTGYRDCFTWTLLVSGHISDINDCFSNAVGVFNHYINSKGSLISEYAREDWVNGQGYWPKVSVEMLSTMGLEKASKKEVFEKMSARRALMSKEALENFVDVCALLKYDEALLEAFKWLQKETPALSISENKWTTSHSNAGVYQYKRAIFWGIYTPGNSGNISINSQKWEEVGRPEIESVLEKMKLSRLLDKPEVRKSLIEKDGSEQSEALNKIEIKKVRFL